MRSYSYWPFWALVICLFCVMSFSRGKMNTVRQFAIAGVAPLWSEINTCRKIFASKFITSGKKDLSESSEAISNSYLALENQKLNAQMEGIYEWLLFDQRIAEEIDRMKILSREKRPDHYWNEFFRRRSEELRRILEIQLQALPAKVIFREPVSWSSSMWINVGEEDNETLGRLIVSKNSPVVLGDSLVGVVEQVGRKESRVRLITDSGLIPSVRAVRGSSQNRSLAILARSFMDRLTAQPEIFSSQEDKKRFLTTLSILIEKLASENKDWYLAKGELYGSSKPLWRSLDQTLKGAGFNYEFADIEGPSRDLRTGAAMDKLIPVMKIIAEGDLLVTSGLDGIFPPGLQVAVVSRVEPLREGSYAYEIEAKPTVLNLSDLSIVFVMPPQNLDYSY